MSPRTRARAKQTRQTRTPPRARMARMTSLRNTTTFTDYIVDQLADVPRLTPRSMFGGLGLYSGDVFFGILAADVLYFKVDDTTKAEYERSGMKPFKPYAAGPSSKSYYTVPLTVIEDSADLCAWARKAITVARRAKK